jgi:hypothetical protein
MVGIRFGPAAKEGVSLRCVLPIGMTDAINWTITPYDLSLVTADRPHKNYSGTSINLSVPPHPIRLPSRESFMGDYE